MILDEEGVRDLGGDIEVISNSFDDEDLDLVCAGSADRAGLFRRRVRSA
jgi:hypothetical protein